MSSIAPDEVAALFGVDSKGLDKPCTEAFFSSIADLVHPWRLVFADLLCQTDMDDVDSEQAGRSEREKRLGCLRKWRSRCGDGATFRAIIAAVLSTGNVQNAQVLCRIISEKLSHDQPLRAAAVSPSPENSIQPSQTKIESVRAMDCDQLADMLEQVITDKKFQPDLQKLIDGNIDGDLFLGLLEDEHLLSDLKLSPGGKAKMRSIINKLKGGSFKLPEAGGQKLLEPDTPWCTAETPADTSPAAVNAITDDGMQGAWIPANAVWPWKEKEIYVEFRNVELLSKWTINNGQTMNTVTVLHYANKWNRIGGGDIPSFVEAENGKQAHIRVSFNNNQLRNSQLGKRAQQVPISQPTMNLDLHNGCPDDQYKKHLIIHEFGHALGLGHEHQRSNFWTCIRPFTEIREMKKDMSEERFSKDWEKIDDSELGFHTQEYDPDSIMHYWFKVEWLTNGYDDKKKVERDRDRGILSQMQAKALLGVHKRRQTLATEPSKDDIALLKQVYGDTCTLPVMDMSTGSAGDVTTIPDAKTTTNGPNASTNGSSGLVAAMTTQKISANR